MSSDPGEWRVTFTKAAIRVKAFHEDKMSESIVKSMFYNKLLVVMNLA